MIIYRYVITIENIEKYNILNIVPISYREKIITLTYSCYREEGVYNKNKIIEKSAKELIQRATQFIGTHAVIWSMIGAAFFG